MVLEKVKAILAEQFDVDEDKITADTDLQEDLLSAFQRCFIFDMTKLVSGALTEKYRIVKEVEVEE